MVVYTCSQKERGKQMKSVSRAILQAYGNNKKNILKVYSILRQQHYTDVQIIKLLLKQAGCKNLTKKSMWSLGKISSNLLKICKEN